MMGLGDLTKQFAKEAIRSSTKDVLESLRPPELSTIADAITGAKPNLQPAHTDNVGATILAQIQAMQKALKDDEELVVICGAGIETLRVLDIFLPSWKVAVLTGIDMEKVVTRVVCAVERLELTCKVMKTAPDTKPVRVRFIAPKA
jgi:hypothetical protein